MTVLVLAPAEAQVSLSLAQSEVEVYFDKPKQSTDYFYDYLPLELVNENNQSTAYVRLTAWLEGEAKDDAGITAFAEKKGYYELLPSESRMVKVYVKVPSGAAQDSYSALLKLSGNFTYDGSTYTPLSGSYPVTISISYPPAMLALRWEGEKDDWGYLKAGKSFVKKLWIGETYGYRGVKGLKLRIKATGNVSLEYNREVGDLEAGKWKAVEVRVSLPERGLTPGRYWLKPEVSASTWFRVVEREVANYSIAKPVLEVSKQEIDFGELSFWEGLNSATVTVWLSETSGYTPAEGVRIYLEEGEKGWVAWNSVTYVPAGGSRQVNFTVSLPPYATLGERKWRFRVESRYAGSAELTARVLVYFPGLEEAKQRLAGLNASEELEPALQNLSAMMESARRITDTREIAMLMAVYSGFYSGVENLAAGRLVAAGRAVKRAEAAAAAIEDESMRGSAVQVVEALAEAWRSNARRHAERLEAEAAGKPLLERADAFRELAVLYGLLDEEQRAEGFERKHGEALERYRARVKAASERLSEAEESLRMAESRSTWVRGRMLLLNPFSYDEVSSAYDEGIENLRKAAELLREAGEMEEAEKAEYRAAGVEKSLSDARRVALVWFGLLGAAYVLGMARTAVALVRWIEDSRELREGALLLAHGEAD